jgi:hypothetical protein
MTIESEKMIVTVEIDGEFWVAVEAVSLEVAKNGYSWLVIRSIEEDEYGALDAFALRGLLAWVEDWARGERR